MNSQTNKYKICLIVLIFFLSLCTLGQYNNTNNKEKNNESEVTKTECKGRLVLSPIIFYSPETSVAFGAAGGYFFRFAGCEKSQRPSSLAPVFMYTLKKQYLINLSADLYFRNNDYHLVAQTSFLRFPDYFYGIGSHTLEEDEEKYTLKNMIFNLSLSRKLGEYLHLGVQYRFMKWNVTDEAIDGKFVTQDIAGNKGGMVSGIGMNLNLDSRDNIYSPRTGAWMDFSSLFFTKFLGSDFRFTFLTLDLRKYFPVFSNHVFAAQILLQHQKGTVPFLMLTQMGGPQLLRGYYQGRFRDKNLMAFQAEYRAPVSGRFGAVVFLSSGHVAPSLKELDFSALKTTYGFGIRYLFDKQERIHLRLDFGFGKDTNGFYFSIFEAF